MARDRHGDKRNRGLNDRKTEQICIKRRFFGAEDQLTQRVTVRKADKRKEQ